MSLLGRVRHKVKRPVRVTLAALQGEECAPRQRAHPSEDVMAAPTMPSKIRQITLEISLFKLSWVGKEQCVAGRGLGQLPPDVEEDTAIARPSRNGRDFSHRAFFLH